MVFFVVFACFPMPNIQRWLSSVAQSRKMLLIWVNSLVGQYITLLEEPQHSDHLLNREHVLATARKFLMNYGIEACRILHSTYDLSLPEALTAEMITTLRRDDPELETILQQSFR